MFSARLRSAGYALLPALALGCSALPNFSSPADAAEFRTQGKPAAVATAPAGPVATHPSKGGERICVSLRVLLGELRRQAVTPEMLDLGGLGWLEGFVIDRISGDVILVGRRAPGWPALHLDDLLVNLRNVSYGEPPPQCSLDPTREGVRKTEALLQAPAPKKRAELRAFSAKFAESLGPQQTVVLGVPRNSRHARVMIEADYRMKKISKGLETVPGVTSTLDHLLAAMRTEFDRTGRLRADQGGFMARYWFELAPGHPTYAADDQGAQLTLCSVQVLTERQRATAQGALVDAPGEDGPSRAFAQQLSERFDEACTRVRDFAELVNLYRLSAVLRTLQAHAALRQVGLDFGPVLSTYTFRAEAPLPASLPALANSREWTGRKGNQIVMLTPMVSGGVSMLMRPTMERVAAGSPAAAELATRLTSWRQETLRARPLPQSLSWPVPAR